MMEPFHVCAHVPQFPAQALLRLRPELAAAAVAVLAGDPPQEQVCSVNAKAARLGVEAGMSRAELESFTGLSILKRSHPEERTARAALLEAAGLFTPRIELQTSPDSALVIVLDMTGSARLFGSTTETVAKIAEAAAQIHLTVQLAASANLHTAVCLASVAKAPIVVESGMEADALRTLPLATLPLTPKQAETLDLWGLHTLGDLARMAEVDLIVRLGQDAKRLRLLARGEYPHLMVPQEPVFTLEEFRAFDAPVDLLESLLFVLGPMLDQLIARAQNRAYALASVEIRLDLEGGGEHERTIKPALPATSRDVLLKLLHLDLQAHPPPAGVINIFLHAEPGDRSKMQLGLFSPQLPESVRLDVTLARIAALVGEDRVGHPRLLDTHRPDSFVMERFTVPQSEAARSANPNTAPRHSVALRRCRPPATLATEAKGSALTGFFYSGKRFHVHQTFGPWRRSGEWWSSAVWSHEEWDVHARTDSGETLLCVVRHDLLKNQWLLAGLYD